MHESCSRTDALGKCGCQNLMAEVIFAYNPSLVNVCLTLGTDLTWYGYDSSVPFGTTEPDEALGYFFYAFKYKATGEFEMRFGIAGNEQLPDVSEMWVVNQDGSYSEVLTWDETAMAYIGTDVDAASYLITLTDICLGFYLLPDTFIHYDFATTETA